VKIKAEEHPAKVRIPDLRILQNQREKNKVSQMTRTAQILKPIITGQVRCSNLYQQIDQF
jgi:hypothetical protein